MTFFPQGVWVNFSLFHSGENRKDSVTFSTVQLILFPQDVWKKERLYYKQELILAVMSRMLFCSSESPLFSFCSTCLMECITVV